jgi:toluene monooxygenase system ferredoxin subunit
VNGRARVRVASVDELWTGEMIGIEVGGQALLLVNLGGRVCAYRDRCAHMGVKLSEGKLEGRVLTCRAHQWQYDLTTGNGVNPQAARLERVEVEVDGDGVYVDIESPHECDERDG